MEPELSPIGILEHLSQDEVTELSTYGEFVPVQTGQYLIAEGQQQDSLFLLVNGSLKIQVTVNDRAIALAPPVEPGQCVGEVNMFDPQDASASVVAAAFCQVWRINRAMLNSFLTDNPSAAAKFLIGISHQLATRVRNANQNLTKARDVLPQLTERLKDIKESITGAQEDISEMIAML
ncbi:MAG TPA: cyclic nucleotide-binding domain-containing protein [Verrucomicrobiales bacterium]|nr:cyclic nucleotide-binding domain-containing protein [Verrucomicrobiales bacterium]